MPHTNSCDIPPSKPYNKANVHENTHALLDTKRIVFVTIQIRYCNPSSFCYNRGMKNKELQKIQGLLFKAYIVYSISADILVVGGIIYLIINGL